GSRACQASGALADGGLVSAPYVGALPENVSGTMSSESLARRERRGNGGRCKIPARERAGSGGLDGSIRPGAGGAGALYDLEGFVEVHVDQVRHGDHRALGIASGDPGKGAGVGARRFVVRPDVVSGGA